LGRDQYDDGFAMFDHEVESLFDELRWFGLYIVLIDVFYEFPHSCLEYSKGMIG